MAGGLEALGDGIGNSSCSGTGTSARWVRAGSSAGSAGTSDLGGVVSTQLTPIGPLNPLRQLLVPAVPH